VLERITIRPSEPSVGPTSVDLGALAEALIFYGRVHVVLNRNALTTLVEDLGPDLVLRLADAEEVEIDYCNNFTGVYTEDADAPTEISLRWPRWPTRRSRVSLRRSSHCTPSELDARDGRRGVSLARCNV
jgi:hypothetical protein